MKTLTLRAPAVLRALRELSPQGDRLSDDALARCHVELGRVPPLLVSDHQLVLGRRGAGKTHLAAALVDATNARPKERGLAVRLDVRTFVTSELAPGPAAGAALLREACRQLAAALSHAVATVLWQNDVPTARSDWERAAARRSEQALSALSRAIEEGAPRPTAAPTRQRERRVDEEKKLAGDAELSFALPEPRGKFGASAQAGASRREARSELVREEAALELDVPGVRAAIAALLHDNELPRLTIALDEWSSLPLSLQPWLADALRRAWLPLPGLSLKLFARPGELRLQTGDGERFVGLQRGGDVLPGLHLDRDLLPDREPSRARAAFAALVDAHVDLGLARQQEPPLPGGASRLLLAPAALERLTLLAGGNVRDALLLVRSASLRGPPARGGGLSIASLDAAARELGAEKRAGVEGDPVATRLFQALVRWALLGEGSRTFLVPEGAAAHPALARLFAARLLHLLEEGWASGARATRADVVVLDAAATIDALRGGKLRHLLRADAESRALARPDRRKARALVLPAALLGPDAQSCPSCDAAVDPRHPVAAKAKLCPSCAAPLGAPPA